MDSTTDFIPFRDYNWGLSALGLLPWNPTAYCLVASIFAVSFWLVVELSVQVFFTFKKHNGLYFWSILAVICGVAFHSVGLLLVVFVPESNQTFSTVIAKIGWIGDSTGFAMVLYSRLHLVVRNSRILHLVLAMIIVDAFLFHTPVIVLLIGRTISPERDWDKYVWPIERVQVVGFALQETLIGSLYIWRTTKFLKSTYNNIRRVMISLIATQVVVFLIDVFMIAIDYHGWFTLKAILHPLSSAVKVKIEFAVLNQLLNVVNSGRTPELFLDSDDQSPSSVAPKRRLSIWADVLSPHTRNPRPQTPSITLPTSDGMLNPNEESVSVEKGLGTDSNNLPCQTVVESRKPLPVYSSSATRLDSGSTLHSDLEDQMRDKDIDDMERQYLGRSWL
jgi:hypothetical protein